MLAGRQQGEEIATAESTCHHGSRFEHSDDMGEKLMGIGRIDVGVYVNPLLRSSSGALVFFHTFLN
jgi:hypothetical protein